MTSLLRRCNGIHQTVLKDGLYVCGNCGMGSKEWPWQRWDRDSLTISPEWLAEHEVKFPRYRRTMTVGGFQVIRGRRSLLRRFWDWAIWSRIPWGRLP